MRFGLTDVDGNPKPALTEFRTFAETLAQVDFPGCERPESDTALVMPSYLEHPYPFTQQDDHTYVFEVLRQAYVAAREADLPVHLAREVDGLPGDKLLYLVPSTKQLTAPAWRDLATAAENGAVVYASYSPGNHPVQRGLWHGDLNGMFGVEHQLRYGLVDPITDDEVVVTFVVEFGGIAEGTVLTFPAGGNENARVFLPVRPTEAEVVAADQHGNPVLLRKKAGTGHLVLCTFPLEGMAAALPHANPEPTYRIYDALAGLAGVSRPVTVADPLVHACELRHRDGRRFVWLVSQAPEEQKVKPVTGGQLTDLASGEPVSEVTLHPYDVRVLALTDF
jgi:endo-1,4-beta-mannosidase